jgi:hypothetical protein
MKLFTCIYLVKTRKWVLQFNWCLWVVASLGRSRGHKNFGEYAISGFELTFITEKIILPYSF